MASGEVTTTIAFSGLGYGFEATSAEVFPHLAAVFVEGNTLNVGLKLPLRFALRETDVMTTQRPLATYFTFSHNFTLP